MYSYTIGATYSDGTGTVTRDSVHFLRLVVGANNARLISEGNLCRHFEMGVLNGIKSLISNFYMSPTLFRTEVLVRRTGNYDETMLRVITNYIGDGNIISDVVPEGVRIRLAWDNRTIPAAVSLLHKIIRDGYLPEESIPNPVETIIRKMLEEDNGAFSIGFYTAAFLFMRPHWHKLPFVMSTGPSSYITTVGTHTGWADFFSFLKGAFPPMFKRIPSHTVLDDNRLSAYNAVKD